MIVGLGLDVVDIPRFRQAVARRGDRFRLRLFDESEVRDCATKADPLLSLAGRFAAKEAFFKALGTGVAQGITWRDAIVVRGENGKPTMELRGVSATLLPPGARVHLSITHSNRTAAAVVVIEA